MSKAQLRVGLRKLSCCPLQILVMQEYLSVPCFLLIFSQAKHMELRA